MNSKVDAFLQRAKQWKNEFERLRQIALACGLSEELKWGTPCYTHGGKNIVLIHGFKEYCAYLLFKGSLLDDPKGILIQQTKNVQSARQIRFTRLQEIVKLEGALKGYIQNAIKVENEGLKVNFKKTTAYEVPKEFQQKLKSMPALKKAFNALTPGRQRGYLLYFSQPKQSSTRMARIEKSLKNIFEGRGLND